jgi:hypothetical protein
VFYNLPYAANRQDTMPPSFLIAFALFLAFLASLAVKKGKLRNISYKSKFTADKRGFGWILKRFLMNFIKKQSSSLFI